MNKELTGYDLSRIWFDFCFENPERIVPNHTAMYFFIIEHCNRLGWKKKFGLPTSMTMDAIGIKSYNTYKKTITDLVDWGFIKMLELSKNQYSSNIIALSKYDKALDKALDKAMMKHGTKQGEGMEQSISSIDKPITFNIEHRTENPYFLNLIFKEKNISELTEINFFEMVVVEMNKVWMKHNPNYTFLKEVDYPALLRIAYLIANKNNISKYETVNVKDNEIVKLFEPFAVFYSTTNVAFYKKLTLDGIANPKNFQSISQNMSQVQLSEEDEITKSMTIDEKERYIRRKNFKPIEQP